MALGPENARAKHNENAAVVGTILDGLISCEESYIVTAEQVENLRTAREELRGYRNFTGYGRSHVNQLIAAVDALFPATEPAEATIDSMLKVPTPVEPVDGIRNFPRCGHYLDVARCTRREHEGDHESTQGDEVIVWPAGEPDPEPAEDGWGDVNPNDPQGRTYRVTAEEYYSVPAETAEEPALCRDPECGACNAAEHPTTAEPGVEQMTAKPFDIDAAVERVSEAVRAAFVNMQRWGLLGPTSAAESWPTWNDVPDGIWFTRNGLGPIVANRKRGAVVDCRRRDGSTIVMPIPDSFAGNPHGPFVPVEVDL
ncbi:hypothetical protein RCF19_03995 [Rhodococcus qingshengii]